jgi:DNA-binding GntR family transcriptional regulator
MPTVEEAGELAISPEQPILELDRTVFDMNDRSVEWRTASCVLGELIYSSDMT